MDFATIASALVDRSPLSQRKIAARLGVGQATVSRWLSGKTLPDLREAVALADLLGVSLDVLAGRTTIDSDREYLDRLVAQHGVREVIRRVLSCSGDPVEGNRAQSALGRNGSH